MRLLLLLALLVPPLAWGQFTSQTEQSFPQPVQAVKPTAPTLGVPLQAATAWRVLVVPSQGTLMGTGKLAAWYFLKIPSVPRCVNGCWFRAPQFDCILSEEEDSGADGRACGDWPVPASARNSSGRIFYTQQVPIGLSDGTATLHIVIGLVTQ